MDLPVLAGPFPLGSRIERNLGPTWPWLLETGGRGTLDGHHGIDMFPTDPDPAPLPGSLIVRSH